jgi:hypothetical protein
MPANSIAGRARSPGLQEKVYEQRQRQKKTRKEKTDENFDGKASGQEGEKREQVLFAYR